jgi:hypothetical protein
MLCLMALVLGGCGGSGSTTSSEGSATSSAGPPTAQAEAPSTGNGAEGGDNSIQTYGAAADGAEKAMIANTAFSFFRALADRDYTKVCAGLASANRKALKAFPKLKHKQGGGCATVLSTLLGTMGPEARKAANGTLTAVRVKGDTAYDLFSPRGGVASYFVLKREGGAWKAISLAPGMPLNPGAAP